MTEANYICWSSIFWGSQIVENKRQATEKNDCDYNKEAVHNVR